MLGPDDLERYIRDHGLNAQLLRHVGHTATVEAAAQALGVPPDRILKTLVFLVDGRPVIFITNGPRRVDPRVLARHFGVGRKKVKMADPATVLELTGYPAGGVPPFAHRTPLPILIDARVLTLPEAFAGGGDEHTMVRLDPTELVRITQATLLEAPDRDPQPTG